MGYSCFNTQWVGILWVVAVLMQFGVCSSSSSSSEAQSLECPYPPGEENTRVEFQQLTDRFWAYDTQSKQWKLVELPFDLWSCNNGCCSKIGTIQNSNKNYSSPHDENNPIVEEEKDTQCPDDMDAESSGDEDLNLVPPLPIRTRMSLTVMSETSIWMTGESGSIYERFWNGMNWVIAPHDLPPSAGYATSVFAINHTFMALSEAGNVYQVKNQDWFRANLILFSIVVFHFLE